MIEAILSLSLASKQLCVIPTDIYENVQCFSVAVGKPSFPTHTGSYEVDKIYTNASLIEPFTNRNLGSKLIGGKLISLKGTLVALHGWHTPITPSMQSHGCIRMNQSDIQQLINNYLFNRIIIR